MSKIKKILLKLSGEALSGNHKMGFDDDVLMSFTQEIFEVYKKGIEIGIVVGGGNFYRGQKATSAVSRHKGDYIGMLATVMNALAIEAYLKELGAKACVLTSTLMEPFAYRYSPRRALELINSKNILIFAGGTGNPYFTTDTAAALKAIEIEADILLKGSNVDGIYSDDPRKNPDAVKFDNISYKQAIEKDLKVMDMTAFALCMENKMPIVVFDIHTKGNLLKIVEGMKIGTIVE